MVHAGDAIKGCASIGRHRVVPLRMRSNSLPMCMDSFLMVVSHVSEVATHDS